MEYQGETERDQTAWLLHEHRGSQKQGIFQEAKPAFDIALSFIDSQKRFVRQFVSCKLIIFPEREA